MKINTPYSRYNLQIKKNDKVLEIGPGHNPSFRSDVLVEKNIFNNDHRCGNLKIYPHQQLVESSGENLPFKDKEFDYVICNQVLEHSEDPVKFLSEISRVGKRGYIETPSILGEFLFPHESHCLVLQSIDNVIVAFSKDRIDHKFDGNYGELFLNYMPYQSLPFKLLNYSEKDLFFMRYEWEGSIEFLFNPSDTKYKSFFLDPWSRKNVEYLYPPRSVFKEIGNVSKAFLYMLKTKYDVLRHNRKKYITYLDYIEKNK